MNPTQKTFADSAASQRPASPTTRPCCWPATPPNATTSPPAVPAWTPDLHHARTPVDQTSGQGPAILDYQMLLQPAEHASDPSAITT